MNPNRNTRGGLISWQRHQLFKPRFQMTLILSLTGFAGFLTSFLLLHSGVSQMWLRYPLAILSAYVAFLLSLRLWLALHRSRGNYDLGVNFDLPIDGGSGGTASSSADFSFGGGGDFGGGGAGGSWGDSVSSSSSLPYSGGNGSSAFDGISLDLDLQELWLLVLAVAALLGGLVASLYIVYIAPVLLAEILVDGLLLRGLYNRVEHIERKHWLQTAVRKTLLPALLCVLFFGVAGGALQAIAPEAKSIGQVWSALTTSQTEK